MKVRIKELNLQWWGIDGANIQRPNLCNSQSTFFLIDPVEIDSLGGTKTSALSQANIDGSLKYTTSSTFVATAANFLNSSWTEKNWTPGNINELATWVNANLANTSINPALNDVTVCLVKGTLNGSDYTIAFAFFGNQGVDTGPDASTSLYLKFNNNVLDSSQSNLSTSVDGSAPAYVAGVDGTAADVDSYIQVNQPGDVALNEFEFGSGNFTIEFWWKPDVLGGTAGSPRRIFCKIGSADFAFDFRIMTYSPNQVVSNITGSITGITSTNYFMAAEFVGVYPSGGDGFGMFGFDTVGIDTSNFHHIAIVRNGSVVTGYFNGVASGSMLNTIGSMQNSGNRYVRVGASGFSPEGAGFGVWDEVRISKVARYTSNFTPVAPY